MSAVAKVYLSLFAERERQFARMLCNCNDYGFRQLYGVCGSCMRYSWGKPEITEQLIAELWGFA